MNRNYLLYIIVISLAIITGNSCKKDTGMIGLDLHDNDSRIIMSIDSSFNLHTYSVLIDTLLTAKPTKVLLGEFYNPELGTSSSNFISAVSPGALAVSLDDFTFDSITFSFKLNSLYGVTTNEIKFGIYEITDDITNYTNLDKNELNINAYKNYPLHVGEPSIDLSIFSDSAYLLVADDSLKEINIRLNDYAVSKLYSSETMDFEEIIDTSFDFTNYFKGIYIEALDVSNKSAIVGFSRDVGESGIFLYFSKDSTMRVTTEDTTYMVDTTYTYRFLYNIFELNSYNIFEHTYNEDIVYNNSSINDTITYIQSMNGLNTVITFDDFASWRDSIDIIINSAILYVNYDTLTYPHSSLQPATSYFIMDYEIDSTLITDYAYDGLPQVYNESEGQIEIKLTQHLQNYIFGKTNTLSLRMKSSSNNNSAHKTSIYGGAHSKKPKLIVTYSKP